MLQLDPERANMRGRFVQALPWLILGAGILLSLGLWYDARVTSREKARVEFDFMLDQVARSIDGRIKSNVQVLRSVEGLFDSSDEVTRREFAAFVAALHLEELYPGIQGVGFSLAIPADRKSAHVEAIRRQGFPDYRVRPAGERELYTSIIYLEPFDWRNQRAFGYDMYAEPVRQRAMARARDTGRAALSGKVTLVQETDKDVQAGVLLYVPVYRLPSPGAGDEARALTGWAYSPLRMKDLMQNLLKREHPEIAGRVAVAIYDGEATATDALLFESEPASGTPGAMRAARRMELAGQPWTVVASELPGFGEPVVAAAERTVLVAELGITLLITLLASTLIRGQANLAEAMNRLTEAKGQAEESRNKLQSIYDASTVAIFFVDNDAVITHANRRMAEMFERPLKDLLGGTYADLVHPGERETATRNVAALLAGEVAGIDAERRYRRGENGEFWGHVTGRRVVDAEGRLTGLVGVIGDVTERRRAAEELAEYREHLEDLVESRTRELAAARDAAEAASRAKSLFLAKMSHELKTPLNGIMGMTGLARRRAADPAQADQLDKSLASAQRLLGLIDEILDVSNIDAGEMRLDDRSFELARVVDEACAVAGGVARTKGIEFVCSIAAGTPEQLCGDAMRIGQVLGHLASNAVKFSERGRVEVRVSATESSARSILLRIEVSDQGIGISPELQARLFDIFVQGDEAFTRRHGGAGLGLALSRRIARLMDGDIGVSSEEGRGSTFWVTMRLGRAVPLRAE